MEAATFSPPAALASGRGGRMLRLRSDDQLVALFRFGNDEAFRVIHDRYQVRLLAYTRQMLSGSRSDAEDAMQDVFLRAYSALRADDRPVTLRAWLYRVAHNRCVDHMRRPANQPTCELYENVHSLHDPCAAAEQREDLARLIEDVRRLPEQQRSALLMRELEGLTYLELADALDLSVPSVKSLLVRARIGLTEAREARDTACVEIRDGILDAHDRGVRVTGQIRRHLRDCEGCCEYRGQLKRMREGFAALGGAPSGWAALAKLVGIGGAGGAATGGGGAAAGGSVAGGSLASGSVAGGSLVAAGGTKVAALVCCAAVFSGGAVEASRELTRRSAEPPAATARASRPPEPRARTLNASSPAPAVVRSERTSDRIAPTAAVASRTARPVVIAPPTAQADLPAAAPRALPSRTLSSEAAQASETGGALAPDPVGELGEPPASQATAGGSGRSPSTTATDPSEGSTAGTTGSPTSAAVAPGKTEAATTTQVAATGTTGPG